MGISNNKFKLGLFIAIVSLFFMSTAYGATYYVDNEEGVDTNSGSSSRPFKTVAKALNTAKSGDTVSINDGTYSEGQLKVPAGVNLTSTSKNNKKVKLQPNTNLDASNPFILLASSAGGNGGQSISYLEIDGINSGKRAYVGISVESRNNVRIHHCNIHDFYGTWRASAVSVESVQLAPSLKWWTFWPADPQSVGNDSNIDALWPSKPVIGFELDNNVITEGGFRDTNSFAATGAVQLWHVKNSTVHHNTITTTSKSQGQCITGMGDKTALLDNVDVYSNTLNNYDSSDRVDFALETWVHKGGCDIYDNVVNGWFSITVGKETNVFNNHLSLPVPQKVKGIAIEFNMQSYSTISHNYIENARWSTIVGFSNAGSKSWITRNVTVRDNVTYSNRSSSIWVSCVGAENRSGLNAIVKNVDVFNNRIVGESSNNSSFGIAVTETDQVSTCSLSDVNVYGNIISGMTEYAGKTVGNVNNVVIEDNNFYGNTRNKWLNGSALNTDYADPGLSIPPELPDSTSALVPPDQQSDGLEAPTLSIIN